MFWSILIDYLVNDLGSGLIMIRRQFMWGTDPIKSKWEYLLNINLTMFVIIYSITIYGQNKKGRAV